MTDYTSILSDIADALKTIGGAPHYWWIPPIAVLVSAAVGFWASQRTIAKQEKRQRTVDSEKKELVFHLLRDEITLRWQAEIGRYLLSLLDKPTLEGLFQFAMMELRLEDVFVFKTVSESFSEYFYLGDHILVSEIVHGYLLVGDLVDFRKQVKRVMGERERKYEQLRTFSLSEEEAKNQLDSRYSKRVEDMWGEFRQKIDAINRRFDELLPKLGSAANRLGGGV